MKYRIAILFILTGFLSGFTHAQVFERNRKETKTYRVYEQTSLEIVNKYGNIHLFNWAKDSVKVEINVQVKANKEVKADKLFEYIDFEFSDSKYYIVVKTLLRQNQGSFWTELSDLANTVFSGSNKIQVDYNVYLPSNMEIRLENKFGNIYCTNHEGQLTIDLSNGDLKANDLTGETNIAVDFGNANINKIENGNIELGYAGLILESAGTLNIESKSSEIELGNVQLLNIQSRRDRFSIDKISAITGESSFSYFTIKQFDHTLKLKTEYGGLKIIALSKSFKTVDLDSRYTDISFNMPDLINCVVDISHTETTGVYFPAIYSGLKLETIDKKTDQYKTSGKIGESVGSSGTIKITIQAGKVAFQESLSLPE